MVRFDAELIKSKLKVKFLGRQFMKNYRPKLMLLKINFLF